MILKLCESFLTFTHLERWPSWSKAHDWKSCIPHKGIEGSNPSLSAKKTVPVRGLFFCARYFPMARLLKRKGPGPLSPAASFCGHTCGVAGP